MKMSFNFLMLNLLSVTNEFIAALNPVFNGIEISVIVKVWLSSVISTLTVGWDPAAKSVIPLKFKFAVT